MAIKHNNVIPNVHFRKWWQRYVKTWFNQAGKKKSRRVKREQKAAKAFPNPARGMLRPVVHPATVRYNFKVRAGKGFTLEELKKAKIPVKKAQSIGVAIDWRRRNHCEESLASNAERLGEYLSKVAILPLKSKAKKGDTARSAVEGMTQNTCKTVLPVKKSFEKEPARKITAEEKATSAYRVMRLARAEKRNLGKKIKKAKEAATKEKK